MPLELDGVRDLAVDLGKAGFQATLLASKVVAKTAHDIEATAKQLAPVDTGTLRNSIGSDVRALTATIGPTVDYAPYQEFGTSRMPPTPFLNPAVDAHADRFTAAMGKVAEQALD